MSEGAKHASSKNADRMLKRTLKDRHVLGHKFFFGYLWARIKRAPLYAQWQEALTSFRRIRLLARLLRFLGILFSVLEAGTLVLLTAALVLVVLPSALLLMTGILLTAWIKSHHSNRILSRLSEEKTTVIAFLGDPPGCFQIQNLRDLASRGYAVFAVSPHWLSPAGIRPSPFYVTFREEAANLYLIRPYYFFSLRKRVLHSKKQIWIF